MNAIRSLWKKFSRKTPRESVPKPDFQNLKGVARMFAKMDYLCRLREHIRQIRFKKWMEIAQTSPDLDQVASAHEHIKQLRSGTYKVHRCDLIELDKSLYELYSKFELDSDYGEQSISPDSGSERDWIGELLIESSYGSCSEQSV